MSNNETPIIKANNSSMSGGPIESPETDIDDDNIGNRVVTEVRGLGAAHLTVDDDFPYSYAAGLRAVNSGKTMADLAMIGDSGSNVEGLGRGRKVPHFYNDTPIDELVDPPMPESSEAPPVREPFNPWKPKTKVAGFLGDPLSDGKFDLNWVEMHVADGSFPMRVFPPKKKNKQADELLKMAEWLCGNTRVRQGRRPLGVQIGDWEAVSVFQPGRKGSPVGYEINVVPLTVEATNKMRFAFHQQFELVPAVLGGGFKPIPEAIYTQLVEKVSFRHLRAPGIAILTVLYNDRKSLLKIHDVFTRHGKMVTLELRKVIPEKLVSYWPPAFQLEALLEGLYGTEEVSYLLDMLRESSKQVKAAPVIKEGGKSFAECLARKVVNDNNLLNTDTSYGK